MTTIAPVLVLVELVVEDIFKVLVVKAPPTARFPAPMDTDVAVDVPPPTTSEPTVELVALVAPPIRTMPPPNETQDDGVVAGPITTVPTVVLLAETVPAVTIHPPPIPVEREEVGPMTMEPDVADVHTTVDVTATVALVVFDPTMMKPPPMPTDVVADGPPISTVPVVDEDADVVPATYSFFATAIPPPTINEPVLAEVDAAVDDTVNPPPKYRALLAI